ncbi:hypothetical protein B0H14DRAFT_3609938 [Mycena olivaceomarginata]|nr:hypothetical protein B0H14DRAFT_3609938 [Mycena olivaceomarginata]
MPKPLSQAWCDRCLRRDFIQAKLALANASASSSAPKPKIIGVPPSQGRGGEPNTTHLVLHFRVPAPALTQEQWQPRWPPCALPSIATDFDVLQDVMPRAPFAHVLRDNTDTAVRTRLRCSLLHALPIPCLRALTLLPRHRAAAPFALHSVPTLPPLRPRITMLATSLTCRFPAPALFSAPVPVLARSPHSVSVPTAAASLLWRRPRPSCIVPLRFPPRRDRLLCRRHARLRCRARLVQNSPRHSTLSVPCRRLRISMPRPHGSRRPQHVRTHSHYPRTRGFAVCPHVLLSPHFCLAPAPATSTCPYVYDDIVVHRTEASMGIAHQRVAACALFKSRRRSRSQMGGPSPDEMEKGKKRWNNGVRGPRAVGAVEMEKDVDYEPVQTARGVPSIPLRGRADGVLRCITRRLATNTFLASRPPLPTPPSVVSQSTRCRRGVPRFPNPPHFKRSRPLSGPHTLCACYALLCMSPGARHAAFPPTIPPAGTAAAALIAPVAPATHTPVPALHLPPPMPPLCCFPVPISPTPALLPHLARRFASTPRFPLRPSTCAPAVRASPVPRTSLRPQRARSTLRSSTHAPKSPLRLCSQFAHSPHPCPCAPRHCPALRASRFIPAHAPLPFALHPAHAPKSPRARAPNLPILPTLALVHRAIAPPSASFAAAAAQRAPPMCAVQRPGRLPQCHAHRCTALAGNTLLACPARSPSTMPCPLLACPAPLARSLPPCVPG